MLKGKKLQKKKYTKLINILEAISENCMCYGINVNLSSAKSKITIINLNTDNVEEKIKIRNNCLLGESKKSLINWDYEDVLGLIICGFEKNKENRKIIENKIKEAYKIDYSYQFKLMEDNIKIFGKEPLILAEILLLSLSEKYENKNPDSIKLFIQFFVVLSNLFNIYIGREITLPDKNLNIIKNLLMIIGQNYKDEKLCNKFSRMLIAWIDCSSTSSTIASRINISARADFIPSIVSGFINCSGKKHTSARIECAKFLLDIKKDLDILSISVFQNKSELKKLLKNKIQSIIDNNCLVYGFGHYIFKGLDEKSYDPRIYVVKDGIKTIFPNSIYLEITNEIVSMFLNGDFEKNGIVFKLPPNSDIFWSSFLLDLFKNYNIIPIELISLFNILTRLAGIIAHSEEQYLEHKPIKITEV
ncbi:MAG TPA: citrate/2-methylcitrate synthase [Rickettsiales bacterium]|nr:citrate/2-methylcitrate synthase [Rickettsiales bacterium]